MQAQWIPKADCVRRTWPWDINSYYYAQAFLLHTLFRLSWKSTANRVQEICNHAVKLPAAVDFSTSFKRLRTWTHELHRRQSKCWICKSLSWTCRSYELDSCASVRQEINNTRFLHRRQSKCQINQSKACRELLIPYEHGVWDILSCQHRDIDIRMLNFIRTVFVLSLRKLVPSLSEECDRRYRR